MKQVIFVLLFVFFLPVFAESQKALQVEKEIKKQPAAFQNSEIDSTKQNEFKDEPMPEGEEEEPLSPIFEDPDDEK